MSLPRVSIVIPAYNASGTLADAISSAIAQTWANREIIVVDDGSTDDTLSIATQFESQGVRVVRKVKGGAAAARNVGLQMSSGDYIQWLDADDLLATTKVERQLQAVGCVMDTQLLLSCAWGTFLHRPERAHFEGSPLWADLTPREWLIRKLSRNAYMQTASWLAPRSLVVRAGLWNTDLLSDDDGEYFSRVLLGAKGVRFVEDARTFYRMPGTASLSSVGSSDRKLEALATSMRLHVHYLRSLDDAEEARAACATYLQRWLPYFYPYRPDLIGEVKKLAAEIGYLLADPQLQWKYRWLVPMVGAKAAKNAETLLRHARWEFLRRVDSVLETVEALVCERRAQ